MEIITTLIMLTCQTHLNYTGCVEDQLRCVDSVVSQKSVIDPYVPESEILASAYLYCKDIYEHPKKK